jgi:hypothetical protein
MGGPRCTRGGDRVSLLAADPVASPLAEARVVAARRGNGLKR